MNSMAFEKNESGVQTDESGRVTVVKLDRHITDPNDDLAVQVTSDPAPPSPFQSIADAVASEDEASAEDEQENPPEE